MSAKFDPAPDDKHDVDPKKAIDADKKHKDLEKGLEDTFPASDPLSETSRNPRRIEFPMPNAILKAGDFRSPAIMLSGVVDYEMYKEFRKQFDKAADAALVVVELSTLGGDPEVARMMGRTSASTVSSRLTDGSSSWGRRPSILLARPS
jgi:hypothetical protein